MLDTAVIGTETPWVFQKIGSQNLKSRHSLNLDNILQNNFNHKLHLVNSEV